MPLPFVAVDGEGGNVSRDGFTSHEYTMLRVGDEYTTGPDWLRFLTLQPKKRIHVAFWFDYDVTMMLRHLPEAALQLLIHTGESFDGPYTIKYRPRKEFAVKYRRTMTTVNDVGTFFQCSFVKALKRWDIGTQAERDAIEAGKDDRSEFVALTPEIIEYNRLECVKLVELMDKFRAACTAIGYLPRFWQGPGQLAKAMLKKHEIPVTDNVPEPNLAGVWDAAQHAYYGGRFETSAVGPIRAPVDAWDINSAYPYATTLLPCLLHATWIPSRRIVPTGLYRVQYTHRAGMRWHGLPHRYPDGTIAFPRHGGGWYWGVELLAALRLGTQVRLRHGFEWKQPCNCRPFDFMHRLYSVRQAIGKSEAGIALKLAMNSVYGVTAQSVGKAEYANPIYAGLITAITRAKLLDALAHAPENVYMLATDGLYARSGSLPLTASSELGGWDLKTYPDGMTIVMPGVYFAGKDDPKTRGVPMPAIIREKQTLIDSYRGNVTDGHDIPLRQFVGLRLAVARGRFDLAGQWIDVTKQVRYDWRTKRQARLTRTPEADRTWPHNGTEGVDSTPYERIIGGLAEARLSERIEWEDAPDWAEQLTEVL